MEDFGEDLEVEDLETTEEEDLGVEAVADLEAAASPLGMGSVEDVEVLETTEEEDMEEDMETMEEDMETTAAAEAMEGEDTAVEDIRNYNLYIFV